MFKERIFLHMPLYNKVDKEKGSKNTMYKKGIMLKLTDILMRENLIAPEEKNKLTRLIKERRDE